MANTYELRMNMSDGTQRKAQFTVPTPTAEDVGARPDTWMPTAEDIGAATPDQVNSTVKKAAPRNLLDNSDFRNPVNQREFVSGTEGSANYTIDRWKLQYSTNMGLESDGISLWNCWSMWQYVNARIKKGRTYTLAVEVRGETGNENAHLELSTKASEILVRRTENNIGTSWKIFTVTFTADRYIAAGEYKFHTGINNSNGQPTKTFIRWAALYEGEYTAETLPEYQPRGYGAELLECLRYFYRFDTAKNGIYITLVTGVTQVPGFLFPVMMRIVPTMTIEKLQTWTSSGFTDVSANISSKRCTQGGLQYIDLNSTVVTKGGVVSLVANFEADFKE